MAQRAVLVDVDERLVLAVVREERGVDADAPGAAGATRRRDREAQGLAVRHRRDVRQRDGHRLAVDVQPQPAGEEVDEGWSVSLRRRGIEQRRGVRESQFVRRVEVVHRQRAGDASGIDPQIEEAERRRVRGGR